MQFKIIRKVRLLFLLLGEKVRLRAGIRHIFMTFARFREQAEFHC